MTSEKGPARIYLESCPRWLIPAIVGLIAIAFGIFTFRQGVSQSSDTATYSEWGDLLISARFNYPEFVRGTNFIIPPFLYCGWVTVVALFKLLFGAHWTTAIVVLNYGLELLALTLLFKLTKQITRSALCVMAAGALTLIAYEQFQWIHYALSDTSFAALTFAIFYLLCAPAQEKSPPKTGRLLSKRNVLLILLVALMLIYRPTGLPVLLLLALLT